MEDKHVSRRSFLRLGTVGLVGAVGATTLPVPGTGVKDAEAAAKIAFTLAIKDALVEMVDQTQVYMWLFSDAVNGPSFPGPVLGGAPTFIFTGDKVTIDVINTLDEDHAFAVIAASDPFTFIKGSFTGRIPPGGHVTVSFKAPAAGTYLYVDPLNNPVNRVLGLHGAMVVRPKLKKNVNTPYTKPTPNVRRLFNALGGPDFPGDPWSPDPASPFNREKIWLFTQVDPTFNFIAQNGGNADNGALNPADFLSDAFVPDYYTISGRSGAFAATEAIAPDIVVSGNIGEPHLIRILNAGVATHSPHQHANHIFVLAVNNVVQDNVVSIDTFTLTTLENNFQQGTPPKDPQDGLRGGSRADWLLPLFRPPDISGPVATPLRDLIPEELALVIPGANGSPGVPQSPLMYPMHCHTEQSQTAIGGNYPQGLITHLDFTGDVDKVPFPNQA